MAEVTQIQNNVIIEVVVNTDEKEVLLKQLNDLLDREMTQDENDEIYTVLSDIHDILEEN